MSVAGGVLVPLQLVMIPLMVKKIGPSTCQRIGCLVALPTFLAIPCAKLISWDDTSLFIVSVQTNLLVAFCIAAVSFFAWSFLQDLSESYNRTAVK